MEFQITQSGQDYRRQSKGRHRAEVGPPPKPVVRPTPFGDTYSFEGEYFRGASLLLVLIDRPAAQREFHILLPHQLYVKKVREWTSTPGTTVAVKFLPPQVWTDWSLPPVSVAVDRTPFAALEKEFGE